MKQRIGNIAALTLVALFLLGAGFRFLSAWELSKPGYVALGILLAAATLWVSEAIPLFVTSFIVLFLSVAWLVPEMRAVGIEASSSAFLATFFSDIILLFLGGFVLSAALHKLHLDEVLARWMIKRTGSSVPALMLGIMSTTAFFSMWLSNTATAAMMLALVLPIVNRLPADDRYRKAILLCIPFSANIGGLGTPIGSPPNAIAMQYLKQAGVAPSFATWMIIGIPGVVSMLLVAWFLLLRMFRGKTTAIQYEGAGSQFKVNFAVIIALATTLLTVLGWMTGTWHGQSSGTVAIVPVLVFFATGLLNVKDLRSLPWDVLLLMGGGLCLGQAISTSGLAEWLVSILPAEAGNVYWLMVAFGVVACVMSSVMSNTAAANLLMPIILGLSVASLTPLLVGVAFACSLAMPLPVSTPPNAMAFSSEQITVQDMMWPGSIITVLGILLTFTIGYVWWSFVGLT